MKSYCHSQLIYLAVLCACDSTLDCKKTNNKYNQKNIFVISLQQLICVMQNKLKDILDSLCYGAVINFALIDLTSNLRSIRIREILRM